MRHITHTADIFRTENATLQNKTAIQSDHDHFTYGDIEKLSNRIANMVMTQNLTPGSRIAILDKNSALFAPLVGGILKARMVPVPINFRLGIAEVDFILRDSNCCILFIGEAHCPMLEPLRKNFPGMGIIGIQDGDMSCPGLSQMLDSISDRDPALDHKKDDVVLQLYTSGTTGNPKGACFTDEAYLTAAETLIAKAALVIESDHQLVAMPLGHVAAYNSLIFTLFTGASAFIVRDIIPDQLLSLFPAHKITTTLFAPAIIQILLSLPNATTTDFSSLRCLFYGAAPMPEALLLKAQDIMGCQFAQLYGMTENLGLGCFLGPEGHDQSKNKFRSCGTEYITGTVRVSTSDGTPCAVGEIGEIQTCGPWTMAGYWNKPDQTKDSFCGKWLKTGDAGYRDEDGYFFIQDRIKDMIITGGENVYPVEVENILMHHPDVADCAIFGIPDDKWGEAIKAAIVLSPETPQDEKAILTWLKDRIAHFKVPKSIDFMDILPRNATGKILKKDLRAPYWSDENRSIG